MAASRWRRKAAATAMHQRTWNLARLRARCSCNRVSGIRNGRRWAPAIVRQVRHVRRHHNSSTQHAPPHTHRSHAHAPHTAHLGEPQSVRRKPERGSARARPKSASFSECKSVLSPTNTFSGCGTRAHTHRVTQASVKHTRTHAYTHTHSDGATMQCAMTRTLTSRCTIPSECRYASASAIQRTMTRASGSSKYG